jgi:hypothetical protein
VCGDANWQLWRPVGRDRRKRRATDTAALLTRRRDRTVICCSGDYAAGAVLVAGERQFHGSSAFRSRFLLRRILPARGGGAPAHLCEELLAQVRDQPSARW